MKFSCAVWDYDSDLTELHTPAAQNDGTRNKLGFCTIVEGEIRNTSRVRYAAYVSYL